MSIVLRLRRNSALGAFVLQSTLPKTRDSQYEKERGAEFIFVGVSTYLYLKY